MTNNTVIDISTKKPVNGVDVSGRTENHPEAVNRPGNGNVQVNHIMRPFVNSIFKPVPSQDELNELFHRGVLDEVMERMNCYRNNRISPPPMDTVLQQVMAKRSELAGRILPNPYITTIVPVRKPHTTSR
jgi:hypothetical protein